MRDRSMRSGTKLAREIQLTDWSTAGNLSNWSSGVQIPRDICICFGRYLYSTKCSWIIISNIFLCINSTGHVMVGPPHVRDPKPLPPDLEEFLSNSGGHGFVIVSFGSNVASNLDKPVVDMLATAFGKLKQRVVWRITGNSGVKHGK